MPKSGQDTQLKKLIKDAVVEALEERRDLLSDAVAEAFEDLAMVRAIQEGASSEDVSQS